MAFQLNNLVVLFGLFALAVPLVLHLLQRRRFDVLDWGAMQFLPDSISAQRRRWLDEIVLMLLRMGMIALIVIALATPTSTSTWLAPLADRSTHDVVLVLDGSYSMDLRLPNQPSPWEEAVRWARTQGERAGSGQRFAIVVARQPPLFWLQDFSSDRAELQSKLDALPPPRGNPGLPRALAAAWQHLQERSQAATKEIIVLTDQQHFGWADPATLAALDNLGSQWRADSARAKSDGLAVPSLRVVKVGAELPSALPNYALAPLTTSRGVARIGQKITLQSGLHLNGFAKFVRPRQVKIAVAGQPTQNLPVPEKVELKQGQIPLSFPLSFTKEGQHVVSLTVETDAGQDVLAADNEQHAVIEVVKEVPVLLVDGDNTLSSESGTFFLRQALAPKEIRTKAVVAISSTALKATTIFPETAAAIKPAVIVLADVPTLSTEQIAALDRFLSEGGGLLIAAGERAMRAKAFYNNQLYRAGQGWLPAQLEEVASAKEGVHPEPRTFQHSALQLFRAAPAGSMNQVHFASWCKVHCSPEQGANPIALFSNNDPFLVEKPYKRGRVILATVPLDRRWDSTLPSAWEFPILVHELISYLAGNRPIATRLEQGAPIQLDLKDAPLQRLTLRTPEIKEKTIDVQSWPWSYENTGAIGVYQVQAADGRSWSYVVPPDLRESNLTRCTEEDWRSIRERLPVVWQTEAASTAAGVPEEARRAELWWLLLLAVLGLLCMEVWLTRRLVLARGR